ncbi:hypothetical protein [Nocardia sp. GP40]|uniref:hypothetical protein n=1 Tax=Nocardia sp. GP40 TaxID=3156268 RepID=UPI003D24E348
MDSSATDEPFGARTKWPSETVVVIARVTGETTVWYWIPFSTPLVASLCAAAGCYAGAASAVPAVIPTAAMAMKTVAVIFPNFMLMNFPP